MISEPKPDFLSTDQLIPIRNTNYLMSDIDILTNKEEDEERLTTVRLIKLETLFYNAFRNTIRILLNKYENLKFRETIEKLTQDIFILYHDKYKTILKILKSIGKDKIIFTDIDIRKYILYYINVYISVN